MHHRLQFANIGYSMSVPTTADPATEIDELLDALMTASRTFVAISAQSIAAVADELDLVQVRILVVIGSRGPCTLGGVAEATGLHVSTASRTCDRMVGLGLVDRAASDADRRNLELTLTPNGEQVLARIMRRRRAALREVAGELSPRKRKRLAAALRDLAAAAGEPSERALWAMGWTTPPTDEDDPESREERA
jgi:DNA-binding MarR family transcriptional regulator